MNWKKAGAIVLILGISVIAVLLAGTISSGINDFFLHPLFRVHVGSFYLNYFTYVIAACFCALLMRKFAVRKWVIIPLLIIMVTTTLIMNISLFYEYQQQNPKYLDIKAPDCFFEYNYKTYWDYLTKGCHISVYDVVRILIYKSICWTGVILLSDFLFRKIAKWRRRSTENQVIDS